MDFIEGILLLIVIGLMVAFAIASWIFVKTKIVKRGFSLPGEESFRDPKTDELVAFPSLSDVASVSLSVIVPAYNEEDRLPVMLEECVGYLQKRAMCSRGFTYEIIVVDDGSKDKTTEVALSWAGKVGSERMRVLTLRQNRGKGGAVRMGMLRARGKRLLFADADGATTFEDVAKLEAKIESLVTKDRDDALVCGSRAHLEKDSISQRTLFRTFLMKGFHFYLWFFGCKSIKDTQCGFKMFTRSTALTTFRSMHLERWAFDVELLKIAEMVGIPLGEVSVRWQEVDGSKLDPMQASIEMFQDIFLLWARYALRVWKLAKSDE